MAWRGKFLKEMHGSDNLESIFDARDDSRLSGREIFERMKGRKEDDEEIEPDFEEEFDQVRIEDEEEDDGVGGVNFNFDEDE
jgi:hypothetical protein